MCGLDCLRPRPRLSVYYVHHQQRGAVCSAPPTNAASTIVPPPARARLLLPRSLSPWRWGGVPTPPPRRGLNAARAHQRFSACLPTSASNFPRADEGNVARHSPLTPHSCSPHRIMHAYVRIFPAQNSALGLAHISSSQRPSLIAYSVRATPLPLSAPFSFPWPPSIFPSLPAGSCR